MQRLLIADTTGICASRLRKALSGMFLIEICKDGKTALEKLRTFDPDVLFLDTALPGIDVFTVLHTLQASGGSVGVIVYSDLTDPLTIRRLNGLGVRCILPKPCAIDAIVTNITDIAFRLRYPDMEDWCVENELDRILLSLSFKTGPSRSKVVWQAVLYRYEHQGCSYLKELCPAVAKICGGNKNSVEKAIRDAIYSAFNDGDKSIWKMYFPPGDKEDYEHPGADDFISRIALCLIQRTRLKPPYVPNQELVK